MNILASSLQKTDIMTLTQYIRPSIFFILLFLWLCFLVYFTQRYPQSLVIICFILPSIGFYFFPAKNTNNRLKQLIFICSYFMFWACFFYWLSALFQTRLIAYSNYFFISYFVMQASGFLVDIIKKRKEKPGAPLGVLITILGISNIFFWVFIATNQHFIIDQSGEILTFGIKEPWYIISVYCLWFTYVIMNGSSLPNLPELIVHSLSLIIASISGQFFLSRLLLASHLFIIDYFIGYTQKNFIINNMPQLGISIYPKQWFVFQSFLSIISIVLLISILIWQSYLYFT